MTYDEIFSLFYIKHDDVLFFKKDENIAYEEMIGMLHGVGAIPYIRKIFDTLTFNDETRTLTYTLKNPVDNETDNDFVADLFSDGMVINWLRQEADTTINTSVLIGGKEEKKLQGNYKTIIDRLESAELKLKKKARNHQYYYGAFS